jgi:hypothetical protein
MLGHALDVSARTERAAGAGQHDRPDVRVIGKTRKRLEEAIQEDTRKGVEALRPVEHQRRNALRRRLDEILLHPSILCLQRSRHCGDTLHIAQILLAAATPCPD